MERVDGYNPLAVADAIRRKREMIEKGEGPILLETITTVTQVIRLLMLPLIALKKKSKHGSHLTQLMLCAKELSDAGLLNEDAITVETDIVSAMTKAFRLASIWKCLPFAIRKNCRI